MPTVTMRRTGVAIAVVAAIVVATVFAVGGGGPATVHAADATSNDTVSVTGVGDADGAPDTLNADFRVHVTRSSVQEALDANATAARRVLAALAKSGVAKKDTRTTNLSIDQHYDNHGNVVGYDASETIRARIHPLDRAGRTISAAATSAGNEVAVDGLSFDIEDDDALVTSARSAAYDDAKARAEQYAQLSGRSLGRVISIKEQIDRPNPEPYYYGDALTASVPAPKSVPIRGGQQTLTVHVSVVWQLN
jgi:uncharacterized protein YggE